MSSFLNSLRSMLMGTGNSSTLDKRLCDIQSALQDIIRHGTLHDDQFSKIKEKLTRIESSLAIPKAEGQQTNHRKLNSSKLIFDIGANHGEDSRFYLDKGFSVVAIEANPLIADELRETFRQEINDGRYTLLNVGIWSDVGTLPFYRNLSNDHWSSFDEGYGCRNGTDFEVLNISCITPETLLSEYGVPYYMKIDVEGADRIILNSLSNTPKLPKFISVEEYGVTAIEDLKRAGYRFFKLRAQRDKSDCVLPIPAKEGQFIRRTFDGRDSGPFGRELPGEWLNYETVMQLFKETIRTEAGQFVGVPGEWFDIHASTELVS